MKPGQKNRNNKQREKQRFRKQLAREGFRIGEIQDIVASVYNTPVKKPTAKAIENHFKIVDQMFEQKCRERLEPHSPIFNNIKTKMPGCACGNEK